MGGAEVALGRDILNRAGIPTFAYPDAAARAFNYMVRYSANLAALYETPAMLDGATPAASAGAALIESALRDRRTLLTEYESKRLLASAGIPTVRTELATSEQEAVRLAGGIGYPVALKLHSLSVTHKSDVGGVLLNLTGEAAVREGWKRLAAINGFDGATVQPMVRTEGYELILGSSVDPQFGPVLLFGSGGTLVEVFRDRALALPPLNSTLALRLMEETRIFRALKGIRGRAPVDLEELQTILVRFSRLVVELPQIREMDINPLIVSDRSQVALDARIVLFPAETPAEALPRPAIRPYPIQYVWNENLPDGASIRIRPIRPEDEPSMVRFHETLSDKSVYFRYFHYLQLNQRVAHERLARICFIDYDRQIALVAESGGEILGVARLTRIPRTGAAEFALVLSDRFQRRGIGARMLARLLDVARQEGITLMTGETLPENLPMVRLARKLGFRVEDYPDQGVMKIAGIPGSPATGT
jgi:acetyltransferase